MTASASGQALQRPKHERKSLPFDHPRSAGNYPTGGSLLNDNPGSVPSDNQQIDKRDDVHLLQRVAGKLLEPGEIPVPDATIARHIEQRSLRLDEGYFSRARLELLVRNGETGLLSLSEEELRTVEWKVEWCRRFESAKANPNYGIKVNLGKQALKDFIVLERDNVDKWYFRKYGERRRPGRPVAPERNENPGELVEKEPKPFDYPSHSTLGIWISAWRSSDRRREGFIPRYGNCGNRMQLSIDVELILKNTIEGYKDLKRPPMSQIFDEIETKLTKANAKRTSGRPLKVSDTTVRNRIAKLNPFEVELGRYGERKAYRRYAMVGVGNQARVPLERVEMDDWEVDLYGFAVKSSVLKVMTAAQRAKLPRVRFTLTIAIDCATRCIVGFQVSPHSPSTPAVRATISSILNCKERMAKYAECGSDWPMGGRPEVIVTDGGPVFDNGEIDYTLAQCGIHRSLPEKDERKRGTIEAFFRAFKYVCRRFAGQSFASVAERGDYDSEKMASVAFETFVKAAITWIVDVYHRRRHRGLEYFTPYSRWELLTARHDMAMVPDTAQQLVAFGFHHKAPVDFNKHGITYLGLSYTGRAMGPLLRLVGYGARMHIVINPNDIGSVLVRVKDEAHRNAILAEAGGDLYGEFLEIRTDPAFAGMTLAERLMGKAEVRALAKKSQNQSDKIRIAGNEKILEGGKTTAMLLGMPSHGLTGEQAERAAVAVDWFGKAARDEVAFAGEQTEISEASFGQLAATPVKTRSGQRKTAAKSDPDPASIPGGKASLPAPAVKPAKPFSRSANQEPDEP